MKPEVLKSWSLEIDYSRAPCLGADQKARGLWERDWAQRSRFLVLTKRSAASGDENAGTRMPRSDVNFCEGADVLADLIVFGRAVKSLQRSCSAMQIILPSGNKYGYS